MRNWAIETKDTGLLCLLYNFLVTNFNILVKNFKEQWSQKVCQFKSLAVKI